MHRSLILAIIAATGLGGSIVHAEDTEVGAELFSDTCSACHGADAKGGGPMAAILSVAPSDLTQLSTGNDGVFPTARVVRRIDGTTEVLAHGGAMPLFGLILEGPSDILLAPDGSEVIAPESIVDIAAWLESIQEDG